MQEIGYTVQNKSKEIRDMKLIPDNVSEHDNVFDVLKERGFIEQTTNEESVRKLLDKEKIKFYIGFDPTADCLHVGHFMQVIIMMYMQKYGHTPVVLIGGGTSMVGDPSGRSDMRQMMTSETIQSNCDNFKLLFDKFIDFDNNYVFDGKQQNKEAEPGKAVAVNNASWLLEPKYVDFIRDVGKHFSVNNMLRAECFKQRLEKGLSFLEFNYMLMQSYDFMVMAKGMDVKMQFGGNDQWSNILGGVDLTRKMIGKEVHGMTFSLLTTSEGKKMGKTQKGALWLNPDKTNPFEFFQYWRNVADADVNKCLRMLTFLPMEEVKRLSSLKDEKINEAKEILAYEVTKLVHGDVEAQKALEGARAAFGSGQNMESIPNAKMDKSRFEGEGEGLVKLIKELGLVNSNGDGFRTIEQGGLKLNGEKVSDTHLKVKIDLFEENKLLIQKGKKKFYIIEID